MSKLDSSILRIVLTAVGTVLVLLTTGINTHDNPILYGVVIGGCVTFGVLFRRKRNRPSDSTPE